MQTADYFIPSSEFLSADELALHDFAFNQRIIKLNDMVAGSLIVTHGDDGAYYITDETLYHVIHGVSLIYVILGFWPIAAYH